MKIAACLSLCLLAGATAMAADETSAATPTTIKEMQHAPNTIDRSVRASGRSEDADTGMAAPITGSDAGIKNMNDNMVYHSQAWHRRHDKMRQARHHSRPVFKSNYDRSVSGTTGATVAPAGTVAGYDRNVTAQDQSTQQKDLEITREIRQGLMSKKDLSTRAHNLTIVSENGLVTLRGTVPTNEEKTTVEQMARGVSGVASLNSLIQVIK